MIAELRELRQECLKVRSDHGRFNEDAAIALGRPGLSGVFDDEVLRGIRELRERAETLEHKAKKWDEAESIVLENGPIRCYNGKEHDRAICERDCLYCMTERAEEQRDELSKALDFVVSINAESDSCGRVVVKIYTEEWQKLRALARLSKET